MDIQRATSFCRDAREGELPRPERVGARQAIWRAEQHRNAAGVRQDECAAKGRWGVLRRLNVGWRLERLNSFCPLRSQLKKALIDYANLIRSSFKTWTHSLTESH